jgi:fatty-acyl-CoA synthase
VLHTLNIRLTAAQLVYIVNHAADEVIFVDRSLTPLLFPLVERFTMVKHIVVMDDGKGEVPPLDDVPTQHDYESLLADAVPVAFAVDDEWRAASMCYTSGTTGDPKGVVYSHRSTFLHTLGVLAAGSLAIDEPDRVLPVVPMFHANAWAPASSRFAARGSPPLTTTTTIRPPRSPPTDGSTRATSPRSTAMATCGSSTGRRT